MNILFVCPYTPTHLRTRPYNLLHTLLARGHRVTLVTNWENDQERSVLTNWEREGARVISRRLTKTRVLANVARGMLSNAPIQAFYSWQQPLAAALRAELSAPCGYDIVHVEHLRGSLYALECWAGVHARAARPAVIWDSVDSISLLFEQTSKYSTSSIARLAATLELQRTRKFEARLAQSFDQVLVTSSSDRSALLGLERAMDNNRKVSARHAIQVVPNGVDLAYFAPHGETRELATIVFSGKMSYHSNITAALYLVQEIMPHVWEAVPEARVKIVGYRPPVKVRALARDPLGRVQVTGTVPDVRPYLARATLAIAPMRYAVGIQNKLLEAMAMATPVIASNQAAAALSAQPGRDFLVGDGTVELAQRIVMLLRNPRLRRELGENARTYVSKNHRWSEITGSLENIYSDSLQAIRSSRNTGVSQPAEARA